MMLRSLSTVWICLALFLISSGAARAEDDSEPAKVENDLGAGREGSRTDDEVVAREEEAIKLDGLNVAQIKELRDRSEKHAFQAEVSRMMKLIINSLYRNKEIFLRELISNASDALDKIRLLSLTDKSALSATEDLHIQIKADKENNVLHITDTGIGMTKQELVTNLGTIAKSGTSDFFSKMQDAAENQDLNDLIGQFGVGFYSSFLVADRVVVTSKHNDDKQHIWESDAASFSVVEDPRGDTLKRGTTVSLYLKEEARDFLEQDTVKNLVKKYSQFINFNIYLWSSKTEEVEEPIEETETESKEDEEEKKTSDDATEDEEDAAVEEDKEEEDKPKTKKVQKTIWDWELLNDSKPIWTRKADEIEDEEYTEFYKSLTKDKDEPLAKIRFSAEGEVSFKSLIFMPKVQPTDSFQKYGTKTDHIKLYVRRVFITDEFDDMMPSYLSFIRGVIDSDDLPLNVSRETLQQHKLLKVIKKKVVRKALDMIKKLDAETFEAFWKEYSTNIKLGVIEDSANRTRLSKLLRFHSSADPEKFTSLEDYVSRMKPKQEHIYFIAGPNMDEVKSSPFVERLLKKGFEVLFLTEAVDEYCVNHLPEFDGKRFQNVAKEGVNLDQGDKAKERAEALEKQFEPLTKWLQDGPLKDKIMKAEVGQRLTTTPCALVSSRFGWTGNMQRLAMSQTHAKTGDAQRQHFLNEKKVFEINPRHPVVKELLRRVEEDSSDATANEMALMMFRTATLRSGYMLPDTVDFASSIEVMMRQTLGLKTDEPVDKEIEEEEEEEAESDDSEGEEIEAEADGDGATDTSAHEEL